MVSGLPETVDLTISGPTSVVQTTRQLKDFTLFVDLRDLEMGEHRISIQTENLSEQLRVQMDPAFVEINIEERVSQEFRIDPELNERLLAEGFVLESMVADPNSVTVTGPKSVIDSISFVKATITGEPGINESFETEARVRVLANDLTKLENVTIEPEAVQVAVGIEEYSKEVPVALSQSGEPPAGIIINSLEPSVENVRIYGPKNIVDEIAELPVEVNVADITAANTELDIDLPLPNGITSLDPEKITVEADITVENELELPEGA
ncbi:YbbR-like domain-containing protein [Planococcus koreensis]|uniref:CdaR family protein n=1 Tax=Planococcus koreensis TaxID=112331 RepID=UPI0039FCCB45